MIVVMQFFNQEGFKKVQSADIWISYMEARDSGVLAAFREVCASDDLPPQHVEALPLHLIDDQPEDLHLVVMMPVPDQSLTRGEIDDQADQFKNYIDDEFGGHLQERGLNINIKISVLPVYRQSAA